VPSRCAVALPAYAGRYLGHHGGSTGRCALLAPCTASRRVCGHHTADRRAPGLPNLAPSWNVAPTQDAAVVRRHPETSECHLDLLKWGLLPYWTKEPTKAQPRSTRIRRQWPNRACSVVLWHSVAASCLRVEGCRGR
jgi:hypothetical protein